MKEIAMQKYVIEYIRARLQSGRDVGWARKLFDKTGCGIHCLKRLAAAVCVCMYV